MLNRRDKKIKQLLSDIRTLQKALDESVVYIDDRLADIPVEDIVKYFNKKRRGGLDEVRETVEKSKEDLKKKWQCFSCGEGYLRLIIINRPDGRHYFRSCNCCDKRTKIKRYTEDVEGAE